MNKKRESIPNIRLTGKWLEKAGFKEGQELEVEVDQGEIHLKIKISSNKI